MKKFFVVACSVMLSLSSYAQLKMYSNGNVALGSSPVSTYQLYVRGTTFSYGDLIVGSTLYPKPYIFFDQSEVILKPILQDLPSIHTGYLGTSSNPWQWIYGDYIYSEGVRLTSDERLKENIMDISSSIEKITELRPVFFDYKSSPIPENETARKYVENLNEKRKNRVGFLAQEVKNVIPEVVEYDTLIDQYYIDYNAIIPYLVGALKEQQTQITTLQQIVTEHEKEILTLKEKQSEAAELSLKNATSIEDISADKENTSLYQNAPNPFSEETEIKFFIPQGITLAKIYIHDLNGGQIKVYNVTERENGSLIIKGSELNSGMYTYTLVVDGAIIGTKRMILTD